MGSTVTVTCWGCHKSETHPMCRGEEEKEQRQEWAERGWRRKTFWPSDHPTMGWDKGPWFCSDDCANNSYNAKQAEEYWRHEEFVDYCRKNEPSALKLFLIIGVIGVLGWSLAECLNAGLQ